MLDDPSREGVGDGRLESVAYFDPEFSLFDEDEEDQAVVILLVTDFPFLRAADGEVLEHFVIERGKDIDDELSARALLERRELFVQRVRGALIEDAGLVGDERGGWWWNFEREDRRREGNESKQKG